MKYPEITRLYKYRVFNIHSLDVLINRRFWFAKASSFNDPFDCGVPFDHSVTRDAAEAYGREKGVRDEQLRGLLNSRGELKEEFKEGFKKKLQEADVRFRDYGVFTMSEICTDILMWSHYAAGHKGFCIEFVRKADNVLGDYKKTRRVQYCDSYPKINPLTEDGGFKLKFFRKARRWEYEREWRLVKEEGDVKVPLDGVDISGIVFGLEMPKSDKEMIRKVTSDLSNIKYHQIVKIPGRYEVRLKESLI